MGSKYASIIWLIFVLYANIINKVSLSLYLQLNFR